MDWINFGLLVATAGGATVAWWQAIESSRGRVDAEKARDEAVRAQKDANKIAVAANRRADEANQTAREALDLQARVDARDREFRDVRWGGEYVLDADKRAVFKLHNVGHTDAQSVTLIYFPPGGAEVAKHLGDIPRGAHADVVIIEEETVPGIVELMKLNDHPWRVHWSSPFGHAEEHAYLGRQLF